MCTRRKRGLFAFLLLLAVPLFAESIRSQNKTYFDSMQWEELNDLAIPPLPEAYTMERNQPVPYSDTIDDGSVYPSVPQLGILDYQNIPEDLLRFCDTAAAALVARSVPAELFTAQKPFLPHFIRFLMERLPVCSHAFYSRPSFKQDGAAFFLVRLTVQQGAGAAKEGAGAVDAVDTSVAEKAHDQDGAAGDAQSAGMDEKADSAAVAADKSGGTDEAAGDTGDMVGSGQTAGKDGDAAQTSVEQTARQSDTDMAVQAAQKPSDTHAEDSGSADGTARKKDTGKKAKKAAVQKWVDIPALFDKAGLPVFIMMEVAAQKEGGSWKIISLDLKGAEYADSALKN